MQSRLVTRWAVLLGLAFLPMNAAAALAQDTAEDAGAGTGQQQLLDAGQLDQLVAPIAVYPDSLLAQVLIASTHPLEVVQADRFAKSNKGLNGDKLEAALGLTIGSEHRQQGFLILGLGRVNQGTDSILRRRELLLRKRNAPIPYHGYYYRILTRQGPNAHGGAYDYLVKGR